jgi:hypothetical protein
LIRFVLIIYLFERPDSQGGTLNSLFFPAVWQLSSWLCILILGGGSTGFVIIYLFERPDSQNGTLNSLFFPAVWQLSSWLCILILGGGSTPFHHSHERSPSCPWTLPP